MVNASNIMLLLFLTNLNHLKLSNVKGLFEQVQVDSGGYGISWNDDIDLSCNELWENGTVVDYV